MVRTAGQHRTRRRLIFLIDCGFLLMFAGTVILALYHIPALVVIASGSGLGLGASILLLVGARRRRQALRLRLRQLSCIATPLDSSNGIAPEVTLKLVLRQKRVATLDQLTDACGMDPVDVDGMLGEMLQAGEIEIITPLSNRIARPPLYRLLTASERSSQAEQQLGKVARALAWNSEPSVA